MAMDLLPYDRKGLEGIVKKLSQIRSPHGQTSAELDYAIKTLPNILIDIVTMVIQQATDNARNYSNQYQTAEANVQQLTPFFSLGWLLGRSPQISNLIYAYFETSSFQPLPEELFQYSSTKQDEIIYAHPGFDDELVKQILITYFKYLTFNPKWFSSLWNWSELGRLISMHPNKDIKFLAACSLSVIVKPGRHQHMMFLQELIGDPIQLIELQLKHQDIFRHKARPLIETRPERATEFMKHLGKSQSGRYEYCSESMTKIANTLLPKRDISLESNHTKKSVEKAMARFVPVPAVCDTLSRIAYAASINKPCLLKGPTGSGKTSILDYIAAHTNRVRPPEYIKVQIGDQVDSKSLVGSYVCTEIPGQFEWQAGPLTRAFAYGSWIVFEDIDSAPPELAQVIHSVVENGNLSCVSCCPIKMDNPHPDFKIFFTQRTRSFGEQEALKLGFGFIERLCDIVEMPELSDDDLREIFEKRYQFDTQMADTILRLFDCAKKSVVSVNMTRAHRLLTLTDLFKLCDRISKKDLKTNDGKYTASYLDNLFMDSLECFVAALPGELQAEPSRNLGQIFSKQTSETDVILSRKPEIRDDGGSLTVGRAVVLDRHKHQDQQESALNSKSTLAFTRQTLQLMESISLCLNHREPVLLVGETGVGKTTIIQHLSSLSNSELTVINLSQQSDSSDLLGGVRPVDMRDVIKPMNDDFYELFKQTHDTTKNEEFLKTHEIRFMSARSASQLKQYLDTMHQIGKKSLKRTLPKDLLMRWKELTIRAKKLHDRLSSRNSSHMALSFTEGALLQAIRRGKWILLDEINLAEPDVLQCLLSILDSLKDSHVYLHCGNEKEGPIFINPKFRVFACMNPSTDIGKRDLPLGIRGRFTEFFVDEVDDPQDLRLIVESYVKTCLKPQQIEGIVTFYQEIRRRSETLSDISGNSPIFSLRSLCRALMICAQNVCRNIEKSLLESLQITFMQQLNASSVQVVIELMDETIFKSVSVKHLNCIEIPMPQDNHRYIAVEKFWIQLSSQQYETDENYILTRTVRSNLQRICRILCLGQRKLPILIQGNTSVGKTSLIKYLAKITGNFFYRINNHEHTDIQEYVGKYVLRETGELQWQDGPLTKAMRKGYWVILDELNLAPSELLEAINRVLDDNRELFIPETRERFSAHHKFALFATQNPPEEYAGRKLLSRAFRNRFVELHFDELPHNELEEILHKRCRMPLTYAKKIVAVMKELQLFRRESVCFGGKNSFMTMRDLFRWGQRYSTFKDTVPDDGFLNWDQFLAKQGLILLEGRVRTINEADIVKNIIEKVFKQKLDRNEIYGLECDTNSQHPDFKHLHFTPEFKQLYVQLSEAMKYGEPVLLCGQTGCGKTTACQLYANETDSELIIYNCHANTESSDFVGNLRPSRKSGESKFPWHDGPLVQAMKRGSIFLMDEISLADDAVLERINSVLEPGRTITVTEHDGQEVKAHKAFRVVATMNPGGDYGKKELSTALRNRFTEIYCYNTTSIKQIMAIIAKSLSPALSGVKIITPLLDVMKDFLIDYYRDQNTISLRDILKWTSFLNVTTRIGRASTLSIQDAVINGACLVFFDQFGTCAHKSIHLNATASWNDDHMQRLLELVSKKFPKLSIYQDKLTSGFQKDDEFVRFGKFMLRKGPLPIDTVSEFVLDPSTVKTNTEKLVRAMQLDRPILLEGDPGSGKTSIVAALARLTGHKLVRINLSDQTDMSDLLGSDLPDSHSAEDEEPRFCWHDGPMLKAIADSSWILLDEMNLASQSVLEGLNACFDHRGEVYISELDKKFVIDRNTTRIFACQNPHSQGSARKGLPQSFINRFTSIYIASHTDEDLCTILSQLHKDLPLELIQKMINFNGLMSDTYKELGYEFNLRDLLYWCELMTRYVDGDAFKKMDLYEPERFVQFVYVDRMRTLADKTDVVDTFEKVFGYPMYEPPFRDIRLGEHSFSIARSSLSRKIRLPPHLDELSILKYQMPYLESIAKSLEFNKMPILVGEPGVGKRSMVKILAGLTGNQLNVLGANSDMDTIELLGSYEQKSLQREMVDFVDQASKFAMSLINDVPKCTQTDSLKRLFKHVWSTLFSASVREQRLAKTELMEAYRFQLTQLEILMEKLQPLCADQRELKCKEFKQNLAGLKKKVLYASESTYSSGNFEWIDSILIKSMKEGSWLLIENANLMNPATLDRLNSLVEPGGALSLSEKGSGPGGIETVHAHPDFRLILTMNPENGELSRAMRNRGVEIFVRTRFYYEDFFMLLNQAGFPINQGTACMTYCFMQTSYDTHMEFTGEKPEDDGALLAQFGLNCSTLLSHQVRRGVAIDNVLAELFIAFYRQRGHLRELADDTIKNFIREKIKQYRAQFVVAVEDTRYRWLNFRYDLRAMTGGDAIPAMLHNERKLLEEWTCPVASGLLNMNELIDNSDIVFCCTSIKIFMELSSAGDFEYRKNCVINQYSTVPEPFFKRMLELVESEIGALQHECLPMIVQDLPTAGPIQAVDMYVDTRNSPDQHYTLQSLNYRDTKSREDLQNRWILSLYRINLSMITDQIEKISLDQGGISLWSLSEKVINNQMLQEDLIRPQAMIASDLFDVLTGLMRFVSNRCLPNNLVVKLMGRFFWISYFSCKLKRAFQKDELVAICNQIPMLWALTYQKIIVPIVEDCELADVPLNNKKFSSRIKHICDFLDVNTTKPSKIEKQYYLKVLNRYASTVKRTESVCRENDKLFNTLIGRYSVRSKAMNFVDDSSASLAASSLVWSNSIYMSAMYKIADLLLEIETIDDNSPQGVVTIREKYEQARNTIVAKRDDYDNHERNLCHEMNYRDKCLSINKRRCALDQFSPIWQTRIIRSRLSKVMHPKTDLRKLNYNQNSIRRMLREVNGVLMSPRYFIAINKFVAAKNSLHVEGELDESVGNDNLSHAFDAPKNDFNMYSAFLVDHLLENIVLDNQVVGWMKMRVTTSDLSSTAPIIPEYSPIISLVSAYCLDLSHLKLNAYNRSIPQLESVLSYMWRTYVHIKFGYKNMLQDLKMAQNLLHLRIEVSDRKEIVGDHKCTNNVECGCLDAFAGQRTAKYAVNVNLVMERADVEDRSVFLAALRLIHFGYYHMLEYAPIFTLDPSLRSREKLEVYKAELAHIKIDLHLRNTLHYWKSGENLRLVEITPDESKLYPFTVRALIERRSKLERSLKKLQREFTNRPKTDDGTHYYELRKEVELTISRYTQCMTAIINDLTTYLSLKKPEVRAQKLSHLNTRCRMIIKNLEKTVARFKSDFILYSDLTTHYLAGLCFILQGMRLLYSRIEQKMQINGMRFSHCLVGKFANRILRLFSFNNFSSNNIELVNAKRTVYPLLPVVCPEDSVSHAQSLLLRSILLQLNHHIMITPSDIKLCIPIVRNVADKFHKAWLERKRFAEEQRKKQEDLYQYRAPSTTLGSQSSIDRQEFFDMANRFPVYDHIYHENVESLTHDNYVNFETEAKLTTLNSKVDLSMCIDVCKAHYKFMKEASLSLLGNSNFTNDTEQLPVIEMDQLIQLEAEILYKVIRKCVTNLDARFDSLTLECHLLQANELVKILRQSQPELSQTGSLKNSIEILDEKIFDIYHNACPHEALKFQELLAKIDEKVEATKGLDKVVGHSGITKLTSRISSFLITDPLMKFVTGAHALLQQLDEWNKVTKQREHKMNEEVDNLIALIHSWRGIELKSWRSSLHRVKRKYIDDTLCDLWFRLYEAFNDPIGSTRRHLFEKFQDEACMDITVEDEYFYQGFISFIKDFFEQATLGDYQIRLDLVFSFAIQTRFAGLYEQSKSSKPRNGDDKSSSKSQRIDYDKLTTYVYNIYRQYQGLLDPMKKILEKEEGALTSELHTEIRVVNWLGRNLWQIKENLRISHRKLNKVMNKYLEVLKRPVEPAGIEHSSSDTKLNVQSIDDSEKLAGIFDTTFDLITRVKTQSEVDIPTQLVSLKQSSHITSKMVSLLQIVNEFSKNRYVGVLIAIEGTIEDNIGEIRNFESQRVQDLVIREYDSKETRAEKLKTCRQIYHSKKSAMNRIFNNLRELGVSYRRGINNQPRLDIGILSLEPLRGMIQNQSRAVLRAANALIEDPLIITCNEMYRSVATKAQSLLAQLRQKREDLTGDQVERIQGYALDMVIDIIGHKRNAASIYKYLMEVQAATTRLQELRNNCDDVVIVYNFSRCHDSVKRFNELTSRTYSSLSKLDALLDCYKTYSGLRSHSLNANNDNDSPERGVLLELIGDVHENCSLLTTDQHRHIQDNLADVRMNLAKVSSKLRDKLKCTVKNYLYSDDDVEEIQQLYHLYIQALDSLMPSIADQQLNARKDTILGSFRSLRMEAEQKLKPYLSKEYLAARTQHIDLQHHSKFDKLDIRLQKLVKQVKLVTQELYKEEKVSFEAKSTSETAKRNARPFNHIDSGKFRDLLRPAQVAKRVSAFIMTLNSEDRSSDIKSVVFRTVPLLTIYTQELSRYLNVILNSLHLKLISADLSISYFINLAVDGFGLPCKIEDLEGGQTGTKTQSSDDNAGFGEGQGETDASKKLEFESQLDELQTDKSQENQTETDAEASESVEAHDDGVEMTEDFDAKAEGPESANNQDGPDQEETDSLNDNNEELDKDFDTVDHDEGQLDNKLWGDEDELLGEDDEEDLREADLDQSIKPEIDDKDLMARNTDLEETKKDTTNKTDDNQTGDKDDERSTELDASNRDLNDADDESALEESTVPKIKQEPIYDDDDQFEPRDDDEDLNFGDIENDDPLLDYINQDEEFAADDNEIEMDLSPNQDPPNDDNLDLDLSDVSESADVDIDNDDPMNRKQQGVAAEDDNTDQIPGDDVNMAGDSDAKGADDSESKNESEGVSGKNEEYGGDNDDIVDQKSVDDDTSKKRTFANRSSIEIDEQIKRRRIEDADPNDARDGPDKNAEKERVQHLEKDNPEAIEVIDLISDSEEDCTPLDTEPVSNEQQLSGKPRDLKSKQDGEEVHQNASQDHNDPLDQQDPQSHYNTNFGLLKYISHGVTENESQGADARSKTSDQKNLMQHIDDILKQSNKHDEHESIETDKLTSLWLECTKSNGHLVHELCQQLQIVLQPTKMSKYRGDYKSGKRLNMRKIISYIASQYRKDKIWLRRTKPCKRTYNISLAVDNSSSMSENNCRQMTYQSLALLAKSLSIIEAGSLNVVSFGENVRCIHDFDQPYVDAIGAQWLRELRFSETKTSYAKLLEYSCESFAKQARQALSNHELRTSVSQLLIIISDGRNITSEEQDVKRLLRHLKSIGVLALFLIIDDSNQNNGRSIMDIKTYDKTEGLRDYMDHFPFPFYMLLRKIESMPSILGEALRQWFELVSNIS